jgi:hypothetical protein
MLKLKSCHIPLFLFGLFCASSLSACADVTVNSDFPGGNALVEKTEGNTFRITPDLRGGKAWFYWYFEAQATKPERATFVLAQSNIGVRGPAISRDNGKTWQWLGIENVATVDANAKPVLNSFFYEFTKPNERIRFSVGIPYVQSNLDEFLSKYSANPHLTKSTLTKSTTGRAVELLQIGKPGAGKRAMLLTARHHACEALADYVLEGFLKEAMSDSPAGVLFREKYVLYAVPFVDKDGVEDGDQGKNRDPHDHNRDYGDAPLYPEIRAIQKLADEKQIFLSMDLHCPALKGDIHEAFHFLGLGVPHVKDNLTEFISWMGEERPPAVMAPLQFLADPAKPNAIDKRINSHYFAIRDGALFSATLEIPYTQPNLALDADMARAYGASMLKAWNRMSFVSAAPQSTRGAAAYAELIAWRKKFNDIYRRTPDEGEALARSVLADANASPVYRAEANNSLALLNSFRRKYPEALAFTAATLKEGGALTTQKTAATIMRLQLLGKAAETTEPAFAAELKSALQFPYLSNPQQTSLYAAAVDFYESRQKYDEAIATARQQFTVAAGYEQGKILNRIAAIYDLQKQPDKAVATRREAVALLKKQIGDKPQRSVFGATMVVEYFDAIMAIPTSTLEEKKAAADLVLNHEVTNKAQKEHVTKSMAALEPTL